MTKRVECNILPKGEEYSENGQRNCSRKIENIVSVVVSVLVVLAVETSSSALVVLVVLVVESSSSACACACVLQIPFGGFPQIMDSVLFPCFFFESFPQKVSVRYLARNLSLN